MNDKDQHNDSANASRRGFVPSGKQEKFKWTKLAPREAEFLQAKGAAFRDLWTSRITKGMTMKMRVRFDQMVNAFHETEEA